eukprot:scaffold113557_cov35-Tisochrysis_lutea.AAC.1
MAAERQTSVMLPSTSHVDSLPMVRLQSPLNEVSPVMSHAAPMRKKVYPESAPTSTQMSTAGIQPTPAAMPAPSVRMPAPATLLTIWTIVIVTELCGGCGLGCFAERRSALGVLRAIASAGRGSACAASTHAHNSSATLAALARTIATPPPPQPRGARSTRSSILLEEGEVGGVEVSIGVRAG